METATPQVNGKVKAKFTIDAIKAKPLFESVFKTINHSTVLPILEDILVQREDGSISFTSTDLENIMSVSMPDDGDDLSCIFPGIELKYLIKNSLDRILDVSIHGDADQPDIAVKNSGFKLRMTSERVSSYPKIIKIEDAKYFTIDVKEIIPYLEKALVYVSNDSLRPAMTGVCFKDRGYSLCIAATDAHRLYWHSICKTPKSYKGCSFVVSKKAISLIIAAFKTEKSISIGFNGVHLRVECEGKKLTTRLLDCRYPEFERVIPTDNALSFNLNRKELSAFLKMCVPFTNKSTGMISIKVFPDKIELNGDDADFGVEFNHSLPVSSPNLDTFNPFQFGINSRFLMEGLEATKNEFVKVESSMQPLKAIIFDECVLIMPLMINE